MSRVTSVIDTDHIISVAQARCDDHGVSIEFSPHASTASTDGKTITIPMIQQPVTQEAMDKLYGFLIHECGHHIRGEVFKIMKAAKPGPQLAALYNIVEDEGMERDMGSRWRGDHIALSNANDIIMNECLEEWGKVFKNPTPEVPWDENDNNPIIAMLLQQVARLKWDTAGEVPLAALIKALPDLIKDELDIYLEEGWHDKIAATKTPYDTWDVACDLAKRMYPGNDDYIEEMRAAGHSGEPRELTEEEQGEGQGRGLGKPGDKKGEDGEKAGIDQGYNISWKDAVLSEHNEWKDPGVGGIGGVGITWEDYTGGNVALAPQKECKFIKLADRTEEKYNGWGGMGTPDSFLTHDADARALGNQIRRYIQSRARSQVSRHKRHGRLDKGSLVKLALPPIDKGDYNRKLFYTQEKRNVQDTAVSILVDWSGSMMGDKMQLAADSAIRLAHVMGKQIGLPVEVLAFTTRESRCDIGILKDFSERQVSKQEMARRFSAFFKNSSGNNDADAVAQAWKRLLKRKESRRVLIVLSDGAPTDTYKGGHPDANLRYVTSQIEKDRRNNIELWGVGIQTNCVERYYSQTEVLSDANDINRTLFAIVKHGYENYLRRGR